MRKVKISSLLFWAYLIVVYISFVGLLVYLTFNVKQIDKSKFKNINLLKDYSNVVPVKKFDTLMVKSASELDIIRVNDTFVVAANGDLNVTQIGKKVIVQAGNKLAAVCGDPDLVLIIGNDMEVSAKGLENLTIIGDSVDLKLSAGNLDKLMLDMKNSQVNVGAAKINKIVLNLKHTTFNLASVAVKEVTGWADTSSLIAAVRILGSKIDVKGGAKLATNKK